LENNSTPKPAHVIWGKNMKKRRRKKRREKRCKCEEQGEKTKEKGEIEVKGAKLTPKRVREE
jgi:hypothetical protein